MSFAGEMLESSTGSVSNDLQSPQESGVPISKSIPPSNPALRRALYEGSLVLFDATMASLALAGAVEAHVEAAFSRQYRRTPQQLDNGEYLQRLTVLRRAIAADVVIASLLDAVIKEVGFSLDENAIDIPRLRANLAGGHRRPGATPVYYAHRDTWYANPAAQINWWMAIHDVCRADSFSFDEAAFVDHVHNDSERFDYDSWKEHVGWQNPAPPREAVYPKSARFGLKGTTPVECAKGQLLLFSASQLHRTTENESALTRFSIDFRTVHLADYLQGQGAPDRDNASKGCTLDDYRHPGQ